MLGEVFAQIEDVNFCSPVRLLLSFMYADLIHSPMNPEKKTFILHIYNVSNKDPF